jgi:hypothetical protein
VDVALQSSIFSLGCISLVKFVNLSAETERLFWGFERGCILKTIHDINSRQAVAD